MASLFGLAPDGVYPAAAVASRAVRSYRTFSPLPGIPEGAGRYIFCGTFRGLAPPRRYLASRPPEPGLSSRRTGKTEATGDCLAGSPMATLDQSARPRNTQAAVASSGLTDNQREPMLCCTETVRLWQ